MPLDTSPPDTIQRHEMLQAGLDLLDQGLTVFDANLRLVAWNEPFLKLLDFPKELAQVGTPFERFIRHNAERGEYGPGDHEAQIAERVAAAANFAPHITERQRPNGKVLLLRGEPLANKGFVTLYTDITEQRYIENLTEHQNIQLDERVRRRTAQLENANANLTRANSENSRIAAALRRSEERLRLINDTIPILIGYVDHNEVYQYANKGYSDWYGHPEGSVTGRGVRDVIGDHVYGQVRENVRKALSGQQVTYEYQMQRQGQNVFARSTLVPETLPEGDTLGFFVFSHETTEQKRMEAALVQAQKMEAIGQLTGGLAHDFNNLLTVVIGNLAALQDHRPDDAEVNEFVEPALQSARRGVQLIRRLLTFSRQQPLEPQAVDIGRLIGGLSKLVRRSLPESIAISTDLASASIHALVDPGQLESALLNFALNARDAMPDGGRLHIAAHPVELSAAAEGVIYFVPESKSPHGVDLAPGGEYVMVSGKLDPHVSVYSVQKIKDAIAANNVEGKDGYGFPILKYEACLEAHVPTGLGPLHTVYDNSGNAYTSHFLDSTVVKFTMGPPYNPPEKAWKVVDKVAVHYNIGHLQAPVEFHGIVRAEYPRD